MGEKVQINMRVDPEFKREVESYVEESNEYTSVTGLIRGAVNAKLKTGDDPIQQSSPAIQSDVQDIKDDLERVRKDVRWLRSHEEDASDISQLANRVRDELEVLPNLSGNMDLPDHVDREKHERERAASMIIDPHSDEEANQEGLNKQRLSDIARRVDAPQSDVRDAIERLKDDFLPVVEVERDGEIHYFLEE